MKFKRIWMVRAGEGAKVIEEFKENSIIAIGWHEVGMIPTGESREAISKRVLEQWPGWSKSTVAASAGQLYRFLNEMEKGDGVVSYHPGRRVYLLGVIDGSAQFDTDTLPEFPRVRPVKWLADVPRDSLSVPTRNSLGAISTLFLLPPEAADEISKAQSGKAAPETPSSEDELDETEQIARDLRSRSREFIKDRISRLDWQQMQELVAGLLRAMGYKTRISPAGSDRGKDILASPDGFGFEQPRIVVEVKHRPSTAMDSQAIRSFLGGRHKDDKGLYVSTGGFTKDAKYEADRGAIPLVLMDLDDLATELLRHYDEMDMEARSLIPLTKIHWPT